MRENEGSGAGDFAAAVRVKCIDRGPQKEIT
jgi:hypothetical protein